MLIDRSRCGRRRRPRIRQHFDSRPGRLLTYSFLHGSVAHLFFNMLALYMFGGDVERLLGSRRFLVYYLVCVLGAAVAQLLVMRGMRGYPVRRWALREASSACCWHSAWRFRSAA
jgi:membrane associated rhomboid family serine protease